MSSFLHKCSVPIIGEKAGGLSEVRRCGKPASLKTKDGKGYICTEHALAAQKHAGGRRG